MAEWSKCLQPDQRVAVFHPQAVMKAIEGISGGDHSKIQGMAEYSYCCNSL